jgi:hypothetical protein
MITQKNKLFQKKKKEKQSSFKMKKKIQKNKSINPKSKYSSFLINFEKDQDNISVNLRNEIKRGDTHNLNNKLKVSTFSSSKLNNLILNMHKSENTTNQDNSKDNSAKMIRNKYSDTNLMHFNNDFNKTLNKGKFDSLLINKINQNNSSANNNYMSVSKQSQNNSVMTNTLSQRNFSSKKSLKRNLSEEFIKGRPSSKKLNRPLTGKESHMFALDYIPQNLNRNNLYAKKLVSRRPCNSANCGKRLFSSLKSKLNGVGDNINYLNYNVKEKTENLVKNQFYLNSYKKSCQILPNNSLSTNTSIILNYKDMWNNVKLYTKIMKEKYSLNEKKIMKDKMLRNRSVSAMNRKRK